MFYGMLSSEGLTDPLILNTFKPIKVVIDYQPESNTSTYWHRYLLQFQDSEIESTTQKLTTLMKPDWYSIFWDNEIVYVVFSNKVFKLNKEENWTSQEYQEVKQYGIEHDIQEHYMDFNDRFAHYKQLLESH